MRCGSTSLITTPSGITKDSATRSSRPRRFLPKHYGACAIVSDSAGCSATTIEKLPSLSAASLGVVVRPLFAPMAIACARVAHNADDSTPRMDRTSRHRGTSNVKLVLRNPVLGSVEGRIERRFSFWTIRGRWLGKCNANQTDLAFGCQPEIRMLRSTLRRDVPDDLLVGCNRPKQLLELFDGGHRLPLLITGVGVL